MLGRKKGSTPRSSEPVSTTVATDNGQEVAASHFISQQASQLDEAARKRLQRMNERLKLLEMQMETLEAGVAKASSDSYE
ncbi:uncharacterized protein LOC102719298 [Oryza brachyantha]|uniref:Uncharacterized protein n=1 Tax=Oryza brachyantha TaxID=4533 RepID=J3M9P4_ORYBR|nr:uncharacterized protein LOC102719298 [Oryza brachyantha]